MSVIQSKYVQVGDTKTHYLEAGTGDNNVVFIHSAEFGGSARNSWEYNIGAFANAGFHVYAVDMVGYGGTSKFFDFDYPQEFRINHITKFLETLYIEDAHFIGNSMGGGTILKVASMQNPLWNINKIITISGGGPNNPEAHQIANRYDCTFEYMRKLHELMFYNEKWHEDDYVEKRFNSSLNKGHWEALAAAGLRSPIHKEGKEEIPEYSPEYVNIKSPTLICAGDKDPLKFPDYADKLSSLIPNSRVELFKDSQHCSHIEYSEQFNELAIDFLKSK